MPPIAGTGDAGGTPQSLTDRKTLVFNIHNFERHEKGEILKTSNVACHGHQWNLKLYPWGSTGKAKAAECVSVYLCCPRDAEQDSITATFTMRAGTTPARDLQSDHTYKRGGSRGYGYPEFMKRSKIISDGLSKNGTLTITVDLQIWKDKVPSWRPTITYQEKVKRMYNAEKGFDVTFAMGTDFVQAHRSVLSLQCPALLEFASEGTRDGADLVPMPGVDPDLFATMVRFMYYNELPNDFVLKDTGTKLLELANKFSYDELKLNLEAELVDADLVTVETAADFLLFGDAHSCALLKDEAMKLVVSKLKDVMTTEGWDALKKSHTLMLEIVQEQAKDGEFDSVSSMRKRLADKGLDTGGTKEMLVKRLKDTEGGSD